MRSFHVSEYLVAQYTLLSKIITDLQNDALRRRELFTDNPFARKFSGRCNTPKSTISLSRFNKFPLG